MKIDKLIAALNKYWRPLSVSDFWDKMDLPMINDAVEMAEFPEHVVEKIWIFEYKPFEVY